MKKSLLFAALLAIKLSANGQSLVSVENEFRNFNYWPHSGLYCTVPGFLLKSNEPCLYATREDSYVLYNSDMEVVKEIPKTLNGFRYGLYVVDVNHNTIYDGSEGALAGISQCVFNDDELFEFIINDANACYVKNEENETLLSIQDFYANAIFSWSDKFYLVGFSPTSESLSTSSIWYRIGKGNSEASVKKVAVPQAMNEVYHYMLNGIAVNGGKGVQIIKYRDGTSRKIIQ